jgi:hypothetical protein
MTEEEKRLQQTREGMANWKLWGPYLSERAWGTVREDYSAEGSAWEYFPHDHARSRVYRWSEDGLLGICDDRQFLCFALALWNGQDPILKERPFGLTGNQGNHGEDVKEYYFYLDSSPTHSYMRAMYKYPQRAFPYQQLIEGNHRAKDQPEFELVDTGIFDENRYFDIVVEYAKSNAEDVLIQITAINLGPEEALLHLLPTLWFRNTWSWGYDDPHPVLYRVPPEAGFDHVLRADHPILGSYSLVCESLNDGPELLFTENETNFARVDPPDGRNLSPYVKDGIDDYIVSGNKAAVNPDMRGTKASAHYTLSIPAGQSVEVRLRLEPQMPQPESLGTGFDRVIKKRRQETDAFYATVSPKGLSEDACRTQRQALAGMLWSKQYYHYNVRHWLMGDPAQPTPADERWKGRNHNWCHLNNASIISMPDKWEYPWYAAWDLAFHCIPLSLVDPDFAKDQLILLLREWFMHPSGQLPAYEWAFGDVNPPVHAWAALRVYQIDRRMGGKGDTKFLERVFHKLLINFTWWVNRKDAEGRNVFQGGFLGLDNIGIFDRSAPIPGGGHLDQSDGTSWMATYCLNMLAIALELARNDSSYEDVAVKFLEHFFYIAHAMNDRVAARDDDGIDLWDEEDGFYYDVLHAQNGDHFFLKVRSMVGLIPLLAVETIEADTLEALPEFKLRLEWFLKNRPELVSNVASVTDPGKSERRLFAVVNAERLRSILARMLDEKEFLSPYGIRSVSKFHHDHPYQLNMDGTTYRVDYEPAESTSGLFGGNSNWRGPIWFPLNYLIIEALQRFDYYYGADFTIEHPTGSGRMCTLWEVTTDLSQRLISLFGQDDSGRRPVLGNVDLFQNNPNWRDLIPFHEYFHAETGQGLGASHQTGWTGLVAKLIQQSGK